MSNIVSYNYKANAYFEKIMNAKSSEGEAERKKL